MEFFPPGSFDDRPDLHACSDRWYASHLKAMREQPLHPPAPDQPEVYRLLFLPTFHQPALIRVTDTGGAWKAVCKRSDGRGGGWGGRLTEETELALSRDQVEEFGQLVDRAAFWEMPSFVDTFGCDGSHAVMESVRAGRYRVVDRWSPRDTPYADLVEFFLGLARRQDIVAYLE